MQEPERLSLYDIVKSKREGTKQSVSRLVYATYFSESALQKVDVAELVGNKIKELSKTSLVSGFMLIRGLFSLHMIECDSIIMNEFIKYLYSEYKREKHIYTMINIVTVNEDNPNRFYDKWYCENLFQTGPQLTDMDKTELQCQERVWELYQQICMAGTKYQQRTIKERQTYKIAQDVPVSIDDINMLLHKRFMSIDEYIEFYIGEIKIDLEDEKIYPQNPPLTRALEFKDVGI